MVHLKAFKITALCTATQLILMALAICKRRNCEPVKLYPYVAKMSIFRVKQKKNLLLQSEMIFSWLIQTCCVSQALCTAALSSCRSSGQDGDWSFASEMIFHFLPLRVI